MTATDDIEEPAEAGESAAQVDSGDAAGDDDTDGHETQVARVLKAPVEVAEPLEATVTQPECRVIDRRVVRRFEELSEGIEKARRRAETIVEEAEAEADAIRDEAREEGRREGYSELLEAISQVRERYRQVQDEAESDTLELAFRIAERIVGREIELEPEVVRDMVANSLEHVRGKRNIVVRVNPEDVPELEKHRDEMSRELEGASLYFEEDRNIERGGCLIETDTNRVDARLEVQLERLKEALEN